jgi:hypothetical protein
MTRLDKLNASAVAGHYGSISIVTFVTAVSLIEARGIASEGYLVAVAAVMEVPAIMSALWMVARTRNAPVFDAQMLRHVLGNGSIVLLVGSFTIGMITGDGRHAGIASVYRCPVYRGIGGVPIGHGIIGWQKPIGEQA